jgi:ABC-2 type transport system ATP-binding protein
LPDTEDADIFRYRQTIDRLAVPPRPADVCCSTLPNRSTAPMSIPMLVVEQLTKTYDRRVAVDALSFSAGPGEIVGLVGPNGAGKTTTLRALAGIHPPTEGAIRIAGRDLAAEPIEAKRRLALVPDEPHLFNALTVGEHLEFTARVYGVADWRPRAEALLAELEMSERRDSLADELSRGMRQKVAIACALLYEPGLLMLDEPLTGLDPRGIRTLYTALRQRAERGATVVLSSHLLGQIESLCTSFLVLRHGRALFHGTKSQMRALYPELAADATLEEIFFRITEGEPPVPGQAVPL